MNFTAREIQIFKDQEYLLTKAKINAKIHELLSITRRKLAVHHKECELSFPDKSHFKSAKISKGENYMGLPYLVLDYPAIFSRTNIFAFRTMFWWGNFFSATMHLQGASHDHYKEKIIREIKGLYNKHIYIGVGSSPWEYHYGNDNYLLIDEADTQFIRSYNFIKLSKKLHLDNWEELPSFSSDFFRTLLEMLS